MCVCAGVVDVLQKPVVAFVRLSDSVVMDAVLEAPVPVRFVFILAGPSDSGLDYHESGRAMGALMADWVREGGREREREREREFNSRLPRFGSLA